MRKELKERGITLPASAKKSDLVTRLTQVLGMDVTSAPLPADTSASSDELMNISVGESDVTTPIPTAKTVAAPAATATTDVISAPVSVPAASSITSTESQSSNGTTVSTAASSVSPVGKAVIKAAGDVKDKLAARAARFGGTGSSSVPTPTVSVGNSQQLEALKKRGERFGEVVSSTVKSLEEKEKLNQRANRFNLSSDEQNPTTKLGLIRKVTSAPESIKRPISASTPEEEERLRKRRERFGLT